jgi:hypothetical protein
MVKRNLETCCPVIGIPFKESTSRLGIKRLGVLPPKSSTWIGGVVFRGIRPLAAMCGRSLTCGGGRSLTCGGGRSLRCGGSLVLWARRFHNRHRLALFLGVRPRLLMRWPRARYRLTGDSQPVHDLWPSPDGGTLPDLRSVLDQLVDSGVASTVPVRLDRHRLPLSLRCRPLMIVRSAATAAIFPVARVTSPHG